MLESIMGFVVWVLWDNRHESILEDWFSCIKGFGTISGRFTVWLLHSFICGQNINIKLPNLAVVHSLKVFPLIFLVNQVPSIKKYVLCNFPVINERNRMWLNLSIAASEATGCLIWNISRWNLEPQICLKKSWTDQQHLPTLPQLLLVRTEFPMQMRGGASILPETARQQQMAFTPILPQTYPNKVQQQSRATGSVFLLAAGVAVGRFCLSSVGGYI